MSMALAGLQRRLGRRLFFAAPFALAAGAAAAQGPDIKFKRSSLVVETGGRELKFEVDMATNDAERSHGLMFRKSLGPYEGMLFDFHQEAHEQVRQGGERGDAVLERHARAHVEDVQIDVKHAQRHRFMVSAECLIRVRRTELCEWSVCHG